jgi:hypothetical protein
MAALRGRLSIGNGLGARNERFLFLFYKKERKRFILKEEAKTPTPG